MTRSRFVLFAALAVLLVGSLGGVVSALPQEGMRVTPSEPVEKDYPAMGAGCPACSSRAAGAGLAANPSAGQCGGRYVWCDAIPVEIVPPTGLADDRDIFFTIVELYWDDSAGNDLDMSFWDNGQSTGSHEQLGSSESTKNPETIRVANADLGQYNIVVVNYTGANTGYKIKARISTDPFTSPTEAVAPDPPKAEEPAAAEEPEDFTPPEDLSGGPAPVIAPDPTLPPAVDASGDSDFGFGFSDLDSRITVEQDDFAAGTGTTAPAPAETVSPALLLASLVGAPALVVGSGAAFAWKRRRDLLI